MLPTLLVAGTILAMGLMLAVLLRTQRRHDAIRTELERMKVVQRDMSTDVRARLEEGARTWEAVETEVRPKLEVLEPSVADLSAALSANLPALTEARERLEAVEERIAASEAKVSGVLERAETEAEERLARIEEAVRTLRNAADERLAELTARVTSLEEGAHPAPEPVVAGSRGKERARGGHGTGWFVFALVLIAGLALAISSLV